MGISLCSALWVLWVFSWLGFCARLFSDRQFLTVNQWTSMQCSNSCGRHFVLCEALCLIFFWWKMPSVIPSLRLCFATSCPVGGARAQWAVPIVIKPFWLPLAYWSGKAFGRHSMWAKWLKIAHYCLLRSTSKWVNGKSFCMEMFMYCVKFPIDFHCLNNVQICWTISAPCNQWHWRPLVARYAIYESCAFGGILWPNLQLMQVVVA